MLKSKDLSQTKSYKVIWDDDTHNTYKLTEEQALNLMQVKIVKSVNLKK